MHLTRPAALVLLGLASCASEGAVAPRVKPGLYAGGSREAVS